MNVLKTIDVNVVIDQTGDTFTVAGNVDGYDFRTLNSYYLQNHVSCLTAQGEWCYDETGAYGSATTDTL